MYETTVNQLVTVAVFLVLQSIQLAGFVSALNIRLSVVQPLFVSKDQEPGTATPFSVRGHNRAFLRPYNAFYSLDV